MFDSGNQSMLIIGVIVFCGIFNVHAFMHCSKFPLRTQQSSHRQASPASASLFGASSDDLNTIERVFCISDLHVDKSENWEWVAEKSKNCSLTERDLLVIAGDISHKVDRIQETFDLIQSNIGCKIMYVPGNHEAWLSHPLPEQDSFVKLELINALCREMGVLVKSRIVGKSSKHPLWVAPLLSWYDGSLSLDGCEDVCADFKYWPWVDFQRTKWSDLLLYEMTSPFARIPIGLADRFHKQNEFEIELIKKYLEKSPDTGILTVSHFLPNQQCLPDWKDLSSPTFQRDAWLKHGAAGMSAKFAKVAGSKKLDEQIRSLQTSSKHIHVFGHSHRPKDFLYKGIRYVHNPLGKPRERQMFMVAPEVEFQLLWDTRTGEIPGQQIIRLWEEQGGGVEALKERLEKFGRLKWRVRS